MANTIHKKRFDESITILSRTPCLVTDGHGLMERSTGGFQLEFFQFQQSGEELQMSVVASVLLTPEQVECIRDSLTETLEAGKAHARNGA